MRAPLADFLKAETWSLHTEAERTGVVSDIIRQRVAMSDYANFIRNLSLIYKTLEGETAWLNRYPALQGVFTPALYRRTRLEADQAYLISSNQALSSEVIFPVTLEYCEHIKRAQHQAPSAMLAHLYVRYLGDLNGGQVLKRLLKSALALPDEGLSFYDFPEVQNLQAVRSGFREAFNQITLSEAARDIAKYAAMAAFQFNIELSKQCQSEAP